LFGARSAHLSEETTVQDDTDSQDTTGGHTSDAGDLPFPETSPEDDHQHLAIAPDGTQYAVPSGMHERLRQVVVATAEMSDERDGDSHAGAVTHIEAEADPKVALALAGWTLLQTDGMTDRLYVDAPDGLDRATAVQQFARAHDIGRVAVARHPSGRTVWGSDVATVLDDLF
jgi:hypothetical protein